MMIPPHSAHVEPTKQANSTIIFIIPSLVSKGIETQMKPILEIALYFDNAGRNIKTVDIALIFFPTSRFLYIIDLLFFYQF